MPTEQNRDDETLSDLPEPKVTEEDAQDVKGGATTSSQLLTTQPTTNPIIPRLIDPCW